MLSFEQAVGEFVETHGPARLRVLADGVDARLPDAALRAVCPVSGFADAVNAFRRAQLVAAVPDQEAIAYLRGVADGYTRKSAAERVELVWSGPASHAVPVRSTAQAFFELCGFATAELLLMTYSARPHPPVIEALTAARARGVRVWVVVETLQGAAGALAGTEPAAAFRGVPGVELWHWPPGARPGPQSKMHAKVVVADRRALLLSSANITESGVAKNLEAGLLVYGGHAPMRAAEHVDQMISVRALVPLHAMQG